MTGLAWRPRIDYDEISPGNYRRSVLLDMPQRPWVSVPLPVGGSRVSGGGVPTTYTIRRDQRARLTLRVWESELPAVHDWIAAAQAPPHHFRYWFDRLDVDTRFTMYLDEPRVGDEVEYDIDDSFPGALTMSVVVRTTNFAPIRLRYF